MVELPELVRQCHENELKSINEGGEVMPHYLLQNDRSELAIVATPWENYRDYNQKRRGVMMVRLVALRHMATSLVFVSEAWVSHATREQLDSDERIEPSQDPDKEEVLLIVSRDHSGATMFRATISHVEGRRFVGPLERMDGIAEDNMSDILPPSEILRDLSADPEKRERLGELIEALGVRDLDDVRPSDLGVVH